MKAKAKSVGNICLVGCGDIIRKAAPAIHRMRELGFKVIAVDFREDPVGRESARPDLFFDLTNENARNDFIRLASRDRFQAIYIANPGNAHLSSTLELQHFTDHLIVSKPVDTNVGLIATMREFQHTNYKYLLPKVVIHDHYLHKPGVQFLIKIMPRLQSEYKFLDRIEMYLVERGSIEDGEPHRLDGLRCGMVFDLGVHLLSILRELVPRNAEWTDRRGTHRRADRSILVTNCATGRYGGSYLGMSTVIPDRRAETFGVVELLVKEKIILSSGHTAENEVPVLVVVGKGVPVDRYASRDLKAVRLRFQTTADVTLDIDTHHFNGISDSILQEEGYYDLDLSQKGINSPLATAAEGGFSSELFQGWGPGTRSVLRLYEGLGPAGKPLGYDDNWCRDLIIRLIQAKGGFLDWDILPDLNRLIIGSPCANSVP